jgi:hypothetical protein
MALLAAMLAPGLQLLLSEAAPQCSMHESLGKACTNEKYVKLLGYRPANSSGQCCQCCAALPACGAWTFHGRGTAEGAKSCLLADRASVPGRIVGATCGSVLPFPSVPPPPPALPPLPPPPAGLQAASLTLRRTLIMSDPTGFLRDPSSPIQAPDGVWHAWAVWVPPRFGTEGWSGFIHHFSSPTLDANWTNHGLALNHSSDPLAFDHSGMCSPGAQYDAVAKRWYLFCELIDAHAPHRLPRFPPSAHRLRRRRRRRRRRRHRHRRNAGGDNRLPTTQGRQPDGQPVGAGLPLAVCVCLSVLSVAKSQLSLLSHGLK